MHGIVIAFVFNAHLVLGGSNPPPLNANSTWFDFAKKFVEMVVAMNLPDIPASTSKIPLKDLVSCVAPEAKENDFLKTSCGNRPGGYDMSDIAECYFVLSELLNNSTKKLDKQLLSKRMLEAPLTPAQKSAFNSTYQACMSSQDFASIPATLTGGKPSKYDKANDPVIVAGCIVKAHLINTCPPKS